MKTWKLFWGLGFILAALLIILDSLGVIAPFTEAVGGVSVGAIIIGIFLISFVISRISKGKICEIFFPLAILFLIFEKNIATLAGLEDKDIISGGAVILVAFLLTVGTAILFPFRVKAKIHIEGSSEGKKSFGRKKRAENSLSVSTVYIDSDSMTPSHIENSIGSCSVYFEKTEYKYLVFDGLKYLKYLKIRQYLTNFYFYVIITTIFLFVKQKEMLI